MGTCDFSHYPVPLAGLAGTEGGTCRKDLDVGCLTWVSPGPSLSRDKPEDVRHGGVEAGQGHLGLWPG